MVQLLTPKLPNGGAVAMLWVDLETTGTDEAFDEVIEIGAIMTDFEFNVLGDPAGFEVIIEPTEYALGRMMKDKVVRDMHNDNGLLGEVLNGQGKDLRTAQYDMLEWMENTLNVKKRKGPVNKFRFMLAGSGVDHFDKRFIVEHLPDVNKLLAFPTLDVGMVRRFLRFSGVEPSHDNTESKDHRALGDIRLHLEEARAYRDMFQINLKPVESVAPVEV